MSYNSVSESTRNSFLPPSSFPTLRIAPPIPPRTTTTSSMRGSPRADVNKDPLTQTMVLRKGERQSRRKSPECPLPQRVTVHPTASEKANSGHLRTQGSSPPPLMPRRGTPQVSSERAHLTTRAGPNNPPSLVLLHRVPSPRSPLHITSTTPTEDCKPVVIHRHPTRATMRENTKTNSSEFQKSQVRNSSSLISWVKKRKQAEGCDPGSSNGRSRGPSAIFYD